MSIESEQLIISNKVISNDIMRNQDARSLTMKNGFYVEHKYPDNRSTMTGENPFSGTEGPDGRENIAESETAGQIG